MKLKDVAGTLMSFEGHLNSSQCLYIFLKVYDFGFEVGWYSLHMCHSFQEMTLYVPWCHHSFSFHYSLFW